MITHCAEPENTFAPGAAADGELWWQCPVGSIVAVPRGTAVARGGTPTCEASSTSFVVSSCRAAASHLRTEMDTETEYRRRLRAATRIIVK